MKYRIATSADCPLLAQMNHHLIRDEGHRNPMTMPELALRMKGWLSADYTAIVFEDASEVVAYALFREQSEEIHLRHLFVVPARRRMGIGRQALQILRLHFWPSSKRLTVDVLTSNKSAVAFWLAMGFSEYCMTLEILPDNKPGA